MDIDVGRDHSGCSLTVVGIPASFRQVLDGATTCSVSFVTCYTSRAWVVTSTTLFVLASCSFIASSNLARSTASLDSLSLWQLTFGD